MEEHIDLVGYLEGALTQKENEEVDAHLKACPQCRDELALLERGQNMVAEIQASFPRFLCPGTEDLMNFSAGRASPDTKREIETHLKFCSRCAGEVSGLCEAIEKDIEMPDESKWVPLPDDLRANITGQAKSVRDRLIEFLLGLKQKGEEGLGDLLDLEELADKLLYGTGEAALSYALERDITLPSQTDLELRIPPSVPDMDIELEDYKLRLQREPSGIRVRITRAGKPAAGCKIKAVLDDRESLELETDEKGEAFLTRT